jgi:hypothetical protein
VEAEPVIRRLLDGADWPSLKPGSSAGSSSFLRNAADIERVWDLQSERALVLVTRGTGPGARLFLRLPRPMEGPIVDAEAGFEIGRAEFLGAPHELSEMSLPEHRGLLLVVLR